MQLFNVIKNSVNILWLESICANKEKENIEKIISYRPEYQTDFCLPQQRKNDKCAHIDNHIKIVFFKKSIVNDILYFGKR